jgi:hypothetical protein
MDLPTVVLAGGDADLRRSRSREEKDNRRRRGEIQERR